MQLLPLVVKGVHYLAQTGYGVQRDSVGVVRTGVLKENQHSLTLVKDTFREREGRCWCYGGITPPSLTF